MTVSLPSSPTNLEPALVDPRSIPHSVRYETMAWTDFALVMFFLLGVAMVGLYLSGRRSKR